MTPFEIATLATLVTAAGGILVGVLKIVGGQTAAREAIVAARKKSQSDPPPADHRPCNEAVDRLTVTLEKNVEESRAFRELFVTWMAREEGFRNGMRQTNEFPVQGGGQE